MRPPGSGDRELDECRRLSYFGNEHRDIGAFVVLRQIQQDINMRGFPAMLKMQKKP
jgi:hypothetical protein